MNWTSKAWAWIRRGLNAAEAGAGQQDTAPLREAGGDAGDQTRTPTGYTPVETGLGGARHAGRPLQSEQPEPQLYLRVPTAADGATPLAGLHPEPHGRPSDGWASGTALTTAADAATALEAARGDRAGAERALLAIALTRRATDGRAERMFVPEGMRAWKADLSEAVSADFDYVFGHDEASMRQAAADAARAGASSNARAAASLPLSDSDAIGRLHSLG